MTLWDRTLSEFREEVASARPTPGGGSVCVVTASLGLGLVIMALEITRTQPDRIERARALLAELSTFADEDVRAFEAYMRAYKAKEDLRGVARQASEVPLAAARVIVDALELAASVEAKPHVQSDVTAGAELLQASLEGLFATLAMNLDQLDQDAHQRVLSEHTKLRARAAMARPEAAERR